jgi:hypothetical protein
MRIDSVIAASLGNAWREGRDIRYDWETAHESIGLFDAAIVPKIEGPLPAPVSEVHFVSDISACRPLSAGQCRRAGGIIQAAIPSRPQT